MEVTTAKERVEIEVKELICKLDKLLEFTNSENFNNLKPTQQNLLLTQKTIMSSYVNILLDRLRAWED